MVHPLLWMVALFLYKKLRYPIAFCRDCIRRSRSAIQRIHAARLLRHSDLFDRDWYLKKNPDVASLGIDPIGHYLAFGSREGRDPGPAFSTRGYLALNKDVGRAGVNPLVHYVKYGQAEGRSLGLTFVTRPNLCLSDLVPSDRVLKIPEKIKVDIIIPVYAGLDETQHCINSVLASAPLNTTIGRIIVVDDAVPECLLREYLFQLGQQINVISNENNLGFVKSVNRGMIFSSDRDVILLNSDTEVVGDWVDRLVAQAYSHSNVGTVTPFSNNATICSYPSMSGSPTIPPGETVASLDAAFRDANFGRSQELPTAVGFCMYIKRACLRHIGLFDEESFGLGYGEENDFCLRATRRGWRHLLAADIFVFHRGEVSFAADAKGHKAVAARLIQSRYPHYNRLISDFVAADPLAPLRVAATAARYRRRKRPVILMLLHHVGGGTDRHVREVVSILAPQATCLTLKVESPSSMLLESLADIFEVRLDVKDLTELRELIQRFGVQRLHVHHLLGLHHDVIGFLTKLALPYDLTMHDYMLMCPRIFMMRNGKYCAEPEELECQRCLQNDPDPLANEILWWRWQGREVIEGAERVICPSRDVALRTKRYAPLANLMVVPHENVVTSTRCIRLPDLVPKMKMRIAVLGAMAEHKGGRFLLECVSAWAATRLNFEVFVVGGFSPSLLQDLRKYRKFVRCSGSYEQNQLFDIIKGFDPHIIFYPQRWPETYSYTLSEGFLACTPLVVPDLGAFRERAYGRPWSWFYPITSTPDEMAKLFNSIRKEIETRTPFAPSISPDLNQPFGTASFYLKEYLAFAQETEPEITA